MEQKTCICGKVFTREDFPKGFTQRKFCSKRCASKDTPEKATAHYLAYHKIKITDQTCEICRTKPAKHRHHPDYSKPLEIKFLCIECHREIHKRPKKQVVIIPKIKFEIAQGKIDNFSISKPLIKTPLEVMNVIQGIAVFN